MSNSGDGREPADDIDVQEEGRVASTVAVAGRRKEVPCASEVAVAVEKKADGVMTGRGGTASVGIGGRRDDRASDVDRLGGWITLTSVSETGRTIAGVDGTGSKLEKKSIDGNIGASSGIRSTKIEKIS